MKPQSAVLFTLGILICVPHAWSNSIGVNFYVPGNSATGPLFDATAGVNDIAGTPLGVDVGQVPRQQFWNDLAGGPSMGNGASIDLQDSVGALTTTDVNWNGTDVASNGGWFGATSDSKLFNGQLLDVLSSRLSVSFTEIPASYQSLGYDIYVYADVDGTGQSLDVRLESTPAGPILEGPVGVLDVQSASLAHPDVLPADYDLAYATNDPSSDLQGNYLVFENRTEDAITITGDFSISAIQLVRNVPEPSLASWLFGLPLLVALVRRSLRSAGRCSWFAGLQPLDNRG